MWVFDYRAFWNPEVDTIKVWFAGVLVGYLYSEPAARELQLRLGGTSIGSGDPDPVPGVEPATAPLIADAAPAPEPSASADPPAAPEGAAASAIDPGTSSVLLDDPPTDNPELIRVTCEGPLKNAICRVLGYQDGCYRVVVVSDGKYEDSETAVSPENCVPHAVQWP